MITKLLKRLSSVKLTIVLLILIISASIVGTLIPRDLTDEEYKDRYGDLYGLLKSLQLIDVYHSYWYTALLTAFCINLIVCSTLVFGPLIESMRRSNAGRVELRGLPYYEKIRLNDGTLNSGEVIRKVKKIISRSLYKLKYSDEDNNLYYFERGKIGRLGPLITHASIVVILIGGIIAGRSGFREYRNIPVGKTVDVPHSVFQVRVDDFKVEFYPESRAPKEYTSILTVIEDGKPVLTKAIEVNHPMKYRGVNFYQSSYGMSNTVEIQVSKKVPDKPDGEVLGKFDIEVGEKIEVPAPGSTGGQLKIKVTSLVPDFVIDSSGNIGTRSRDPNNPAVLVELYEGNERKHRSWAFQKHPDFHAPGGSDYMVKFLSTGYYTGLQISRTSGLPVVWSGFILMIIGMFLAFYLPYKRIWIRLSADSVEMGGSSYKNRAGFEKEFGRLKAPFQ